jgi:hypothetical protein
MEKIEVEIKVSELVRVDIDVEDVIDAMNELDIKKRWNYIGKILNGVQMDLSSLNDEQKNIIKKYLTNRLELFQSS